MPAPSLDHIRSIPLFAGLDEALLTQICEIATEFDAPAGSLLAERGQPGTGIFLIEEGTVVVDLPHGGQEELGPGEFFGEVSVLTDRSRRARVRALTDVECIAIGRKDLWRLLESEPRIALAMLPVVAARLADAD